MVAKFATGDFHVINGVLQTGASIFEKYSYETKSQKLWEEIKFVLDNFAAAFTELLKATTGLAKQHAQDQAALKVKLPLVFLSKRKPFGVTNIFLLPGNDQD